MKKRTKYLWIAFGLHMIAWMIMAALMRPVPWQAVIYALYGFFVYGIWDDIDEITSDNKENG